MFDEDYLDIDIILRDKPRVNMLRPYSVNQRVGVLAGDQAMYDLVNLDAEDKTMMLMNDTFAFVLM